MLQYIIELKKQAATHEDSFKEEQQKCKMKDFEISSLKELLQAAELGFKEDDEEWQKDYVALRKELDLQNESNEELEKEKTTLQQEVDVLKALLEAAEIALKKDDEEWRQDYSKISEENKSLKEENDNLNQNIESLKQEKDILQTENDKIKEENKALITEKENATTVHQSDLDAALLSHKADSEEWRLEYHNLIEKYDSLKLENDKLLKQQLEAAMIGRRTSIEQLEDMETSLQSTTQEIAVLKVANEEAEREIMLLNNDKSTFDQKLVSLEEQSKIKENDLIATNETLNRELMEVRAKLANTSEENQKLHQSLSVDLCSLRQSSIPQQSFQNEINNLKLQLTKVRSEYEKMRQMYGESHSTANVLQSDLLSTKAQLALLREVQERDAKLLQMKDEREEGLKATIDRLNQKIKMLEQDCLKKQTPDTCSDDTSTTAFYIRKSVVTAEGADVVMCKQIIDKTDLFYGQRVVIQRTNDKYEFGVVRAFPEYISGNMNIVGIELDLPSTHMYVCVRIM